MNRTTMLMMAEVLRRRMETGLNKNNLPDMLLLDGGKGQLNIAYQCSW